MCSLVTHDRDRHVPVLDREPDRDQDQERPRSRCCPFVLDDDLYRLLL